jgi:hypothetical protein
MTLDLILHEPCQKNYKKKLEKIVSVDAACDIGSIIEFAKFVEYQDQAMEISFFWT